MRRDGALFVYTHAMESSRIASFQRGVNRLARRLGQAGLIDHEREAMRKSDHRNAIRSHEHFDALCAAAGLRVSERRYYNVFFKAVIEDLFLRLDRAAAAPPRRHRGSGRACARRMVMVRPGTPTSLRHCPPRVSRADRRRRLSSWLWRRRSRG